MKTLELNQMETMLGGDIGDYFLCGAAIGFGAVLGFGLGGPAGSAYGVVAGAYLGCAEEVH